MALRLAYAKNYMRKMVNIRVDLRSLVREDYEKFVSQRHHLNKGPGWLCNGERSSEPWCWRWLSLWHILRD